MSVIEKLSGISDALTKLINFTLNDETVKSDFEEYLTAVSGQNTPQSQLQQVLIPYIFERRLPESKKTITEVYKEKNTDITKEEKEIIDALETSFSSVFEIRRLFGSGFELYNLIDEQIYRVVSLSKMNNFRGVSPGQFALCRIFKYDDEYFLTEISNVISSQNKEEVYKYAIARIIERPEGAYENNPKKRAEIENSVKEFGKKFIEFFGKDEVITTNNHADNLINLFNTYCEENKLPDKEEIDKNLVEISNYRFFTVSDFRNSYSDFMEKSLEGFSSHTDNYDIGIIYEKNLGLFVLPFYQTFCKIYEVQDHKTIQGYKDCIKNFLENDKIPADIIRKVAEKYENFLSRTNEILETNYQSVKELIEYFKPDSSDKKIFSSTSVLYASKIFEKMMNAVTEKENIKQHADIDYSNTGRNDKCPCGSGKKYKNCCMPR